MYSRQLIALATLLGISLATQLALHWFRVCRALYKRGEKFPTGLLFWRWFTELRHYREILAAHCESLTPYYVTFILTWFNLLLGLGVGLRALWEQTHPLR